MARRRQQGRRRDPAGRHDGGNAAGAPAGVMVGHQYPQTTQGIGDSFPELSRIASRPGYQTGLGTSGWGQTVDQPLPSAPGYLAALDISIYASAGATTATGGVALATTPTGVDAGVFAGSIVNQHVFRDAAGTIIANTTEPLAPYLIDMFSGQVGVDHAADVATWPSYKAIQTSSASAGNMLAHYRLPVMFAPGALGAIAVGAQDLMPTLHLNLASLASVFTTAPTTAPSLSIQVDEEYWPAVPGMQPTDIGTTLQWQQITANPSLVSGSTAKLMLGKSDGYCTTVILVFRDSTGARSDYMLPGGVSSSTTIPFANPASIGKRLQLWVDGVLVRDEDINQVIDRMYRSFPGLVVTGNRVGPTGVLVYSFRNSISEAVLGPDDGALWMPMSPGTQLEIAGVPWGTFANSPGQVTALIGSIVPGPGGVARGVVNINPAGPQ